MRGLLGISPDLSGIKWRKHDFLLFIFCYFEFVRACLLFSVALSCNLALACGVDPRAKDDGKEVEH